MVPQDQSRGEDMQLEHVLSYIQRNGGAGLEDRTRTHWASLL